MKTLTHQYEYSDYLNRGFLDEIDRASVRTILELGANDGRDTLELRAMFGGEIHAFECHPEMISEARKRYQPFPDIRLVEKAVWDKNGVIPFYPVIRTLYKGEEIANPGASSCFHARDDYHQRYEQSIIQVESVRLDTYCAEHRLERIDLLCIDVQGAALHALRGLGERLRNVRYLIAEIETRPLYHGQDLYPEVKAYLETYGFEVRAKVPRDDWFSDYLFIGDPDWLPPTTLRQRARRWLRRLGKAGSRSK